MNYKGFEEKVTRALNHGTEPAASLKEETYYRIKEEIDRIDKGEIKLSKRKKTGAKHIISIGTIAAVLTVSFMMATQPGQAALDKIRQWFEPEKKIVDEIEGMPEDINGKLQESTMGYVLYYDQDRYMVVSEDGIDRIETIEKPENYPPVFMEISQDTERTPEELAAEWEEKLKAEFVKVKNYGWVDWPLDSIMLYANTGNNWNDTVVKYYFVDNTQGGTFVIKQQLFFEASEGHGVRLDNALKEFTIVSLDEE